MGIKEIEANGCVGNQMSFAEIALGVRGCVCGR